MNTATILPAGTVPADRAEAMLTAAMTRLEAADAAYEEYINLACEREQLYGLWCHSTDEAERAALQARSKAMQSELDELWRRAWEL
jgi:hypothetical protein